MLLRPRRGRRVVSGAEQAGGLTGLAGPQAEEPALGEGRRVDGLRRIGQRGIDLEHLAVDRRVDIGGCLGGLDHHAGLARAHLAAGLGQVDIDQFAQRILGMEGDADGDGAVAVVAQPLVAGGVAEVCGVVHGGLLGGRGRVATAWRPPVREPPLSVCLRHSASAARAGRGQPVSFGEAAATAGAGARLLSRESKLRQSFCLRVFGAIHLRRHPRCRG